MLVWLDCDPDIVARDVDLCFRILAFLGAEPGFCVNWWRIPFDRNAKPNLFPTRAEVNGGWARTGVPEVFIYRLEEWDRVLIHECIHALGWDVSPGLPLKHCLEKTLGGGKLMDALFEAATELNAEWLWCIVHAPVDDKDGSTWVKQKQWQQKQAFAVLARSEAVWNEDTSVFAYYVLKAVLGLEMESFLIQWLSGSVETNGWCVLWSKYKDVFLRNAQKDNTRNSTISMRMTNPALE